MPYILPLVRSTHALLFIFITFSETKLPPTCKCESFTASFGHCCNAKTDFTAGAESPAVTPVSATLMYVSRAQPARTRADQYLFKTSRTFGSGTPSSRAVEVVCSLAPQLLLRSMYHFFKEVLLVTLVQGKGDRIRTAGCKHLSSLWACVSLLLLVHCAQAAKTVI